MITLKDYAKQHNVTYEAIRSQVNRYREQLGDHIIQEGRQQFLDDYAVAFLDDRRQKNPVVVYQQEKDEQIEQLEKENKILLAKLATRNEQVLDLMQYKLTSEEQKRALEDAKTAQERRERELDEREGQMTQEISEAVQRASEGVRKAVEEEKDREIAQVRQKAAAELTAANDALEQMREEAFQRLQEAEAAEERELQAQKEAEQLRAELEDRQAHPWKYLFRRKGRV